MERMKLWVPNPEVGCENGVYGIYEKKGKEVTFKPCTKKIVYKESEKDIEEGTTEYKVSVDECWGEQEYSITRLRDYWEVPFGVGEEEKTIWCKALENEALWRGQKAYYRELGFDYNVSDKPIFKGSEAIGLEARYKGHYPVHEEGDMFIWCELLEREIVHWEPLFFILCASTAGVITDFLKEDSIRIQLTGAKDDVWTAGLFGIACGSSPNARISSLVFERESSINKYNCMHHNSYPCIVKGRPVLSCISDKNHCHATFYAIDEKKAVETKKGKTHSKNATPWLEFIDVQWLKHDYHGFRIMEELKETHGLWIPSIARSLMKMGELKIRYYVSKAIKEFKDYAKENVTFSKVPEEIIKQIAFIIAAAEIIEKEYHLYAKKESVIEFILQNACVAWREEPKFPSDRKKYPKKGE